MSTRDRSPLTDPEWARSVQKQVNSQRDKTTVRIGPWVFSTDDDGNVRATAPGRDPVVLTPTPVTEDTTVPPAVSGVSIKLYRADTGGIALPTATAPPAVLPDDTFDSVAWVSANITAYDVATGSITVPVEGTYTIAHRVEISGSLGAVAVTPILFVNGEQREAGQSQLNTDGFNGADSWSHTWVTRLLSGDIVQAGRYQGSGFTGIGNADATKTYLTLARCGG